MEHVSDWDNKVISCPRQDPHESHTNEGSPGSQMIIVTCPGVAVPKETDIPHCATCQCGRWFPIQGDWQRNREDGRPSKPPGKITWAEAEEIYAAYAGQHGTSQSIERMAERGGFGYYECELFTGHEPKTWRVR